MRFISEVDPEVRFIINKHTRSRRVARALAIGLAVIGLAQVGHSARAETDTPAARLSAPLDALPLEATPHAEPAATSPQAEPATRDPRDADDASAAAEPAQVELLARKLGELQVRMQQLDWLSEQLADMAGVPPESYRFEHRDGKGGPMIELEPMSLPQLRRALDEFEQQVDARADHLAVVEARMLDLLAAHELTPSRMPVDGYRYRSSSYGPRFDPISRRRSFHEGIDFAAPHGTPILAAAGGVVREARRFRGYGNMIELDHGDGLVTRYAHAARMLVKPGELVTRGQQVATVGSTGRSTGPHLHFEVLVAGQPADPRLYLAGTGSPLSQALARLE